MFCLFARKPVYSLCKEMPESFCLTSWLPLASAAERVQLRLRLRRPTDLLERHDLQEVREEADKEGAARHATGDDGVPDHLAVHVDDALKEVLECKDPIRDGEEVSLRQR